MALIHIIFFKPLGIIIRVEWLLVFRFLFRISWRYFGYHGDIFH